MINKKNNNVKVVKNTKGAIKSKGKKEDSELVKLIKITIGVAIVFAAFYGLAVLIDNMSKEEEKEVAETEIQYDEILIGRLLEQPYAEYYVLVSLEEDTYLTNYQSYMQSYALKNALKVYTANLNNVFNKAYVGDKLVTKISSIADVRFKDSTLVYIKNKKITKAYEGGSAILKQFEKLTNS